jgi:filamentous hemagglutinin
MTYSEDGQGANVEQVASMVGSLGGNVSIEAAGTYTQTASNVTAAAGFAAGTGGADSGNITIQAGEVLIDAGTNTASSQQSMSQRKTAIGTDISIPVLNTAKSLRDVAQAATETSDGRAQAMAGATLAMQGRDLASAVQNGISDPTSLQNGFKASLTLGSSRSQSTMAQTSETSVGSTVSGSGNVTIVAKGINGEGGNINVVGSQVQAGGNVVLSARDQINLLASQDTYTQASNSSSSGASIGIAFNISGDKSGFTLDLAANQARGKADGTDVIFRNTHIEGGNGVTLISGGDTTLKGATISAPTVSGLIGGDLTIASLQDISSYASKQSGSSIGVSLCIPPFCTGISSVTGGLSRSTVDGAFASVTETSGIRAGDGGFQLIVGGNTSLEGGVIASSDKAVTDNKNLLQTATLTTLDLVNRDFYEASGFSISGGVGKDKPTGSAGVGSAEGAQESITRAGISGGTVTITNGAAQHALTGKTVEEMLASLDREVTSGTADAGALAKAWDATRLQRDVNAQVLITSEFGKAAAKEIGDYAKTQMNRVEALRETAKLEKDEGRKQALLAEAQEIEGNWKEGGTLRVAAHAATGALSGGLLGALGAGTSAAVMPTLSKLIDNLDLPGPLKQALGAAAAVAVGSVGGASGAAAAFNIDVNNRQLHPDEIAFLKGKVASYAQREGISEEEAERRLVRGALYLNDADWAKQYDNFTADEVADYSAAGGWLRDTAKSEGVSFATPSGDLQAMFTSTPDQFKNERFLLSQAMSDSNTSVLYGSTAAIRIRELGFKGGLEFTFDASVGFGKGVPAGALEALKSYASLVDSETYKRLYAAVAQLLDNPADTLKTMMNGAEGAAKDFAFSTYLNYLQKDSQALGELTGKITGSLLVDFAATWAGVKVVGAIADSGRAARLRYSSEIEEINYSTGNGPTGAGSAPNPVDLNSQATQNVGRITAPIDFDGHVLRAEIKSNGNVVGGHSTASGEVQVIPGTASPPNAQGVYTAKIQVVDPSNPGQLLPKTNNGGVSTMFPDSWSADRIKVEVDAAYNNKTVVGNKWSGITPSGVVVEGFLKPKATVYPKF